MGLAIAFSASALQLVTGHASARGVSVHQPAKLAAFEGLYETQADAPLYLFGWVDEERGQVRGGPALRGMLSWLVHGDPNAEVTGLNEFPPADRPPVQPVFQSYHLMVAIGMGLLGVSAAGLVLLRGGRLFRSHPLLRVMVLSVLGPQAANQLGWFSAEVGRQPWVVHGLLRTSEGLSAVVTTGQVAASLLLFGSVYVLLLAVFLYLLDDKIRHGPDDADLVPSGKLALPGRPVA
jgi:cytochrome d ubiquinol oxidase subunit I